MTKENIATEIYDFHGALSKLEAHKIVRTIVEAMKQKLTEGEKIQISGFGSIEIVRRRGRKGKNPLTGKDFFISDKRVIKFKPSKKLLGNID